MKQLSILLLFLVPALSTAQNTKRLCFKDFYSKGLGYMDRQEYGEAISQFVAALVTCDDVPVDNDVSIRIEESKRRWAADLEASVADAKKSYREALVAKEAAESAKAAESSARKLAEENARRAYQRGVRAESYRLALLADMARGRGSKTDALLLSWMGLQLSDTLQPYVWRSFGEAVRDTLSQLLFRSDAEIASLEFMGKGERVLLRTDKRSWYVISLGETPQVVELPAQFIAVHPSPDGKRLAAWTSKGNDISVMSAEGKLEATLSGHSDGIQNVVFSPDGSRILSGSRDNTACIWDLSGRLLTRLSGHTGNITAAEFSPDGRLVLTRSIDGTARLWSADGAFLREFSTSKGVVYRAYFSAENAVWVQFNNFKIATWNASGAPVDSLETSPLFLLPFAPSPSGKWLAARTQNQAIALLDKSGKKGPVLQLRYDLFGLEFTSDDRLITWGRNNILQIWNMDGTLSCTYQGHRKSITGVDYLPGRNLLLSTSADGTVKLWDAAGNVLCEWQTGTKTPVTARFSPSGDRVFITIEGGRNLIRTPLQQEVFEKADKKALLRSAPLKQVAALYGVQFLEAISNE